MQLSTAHADGFWMEIFNDVLADLRLGEIWTINMGEPEFGKDPQTFVNLIVFDSKAHIRVGRSTHAVNCRFFSTLNTISCDVEFFRFMISRFGFDKDVTVEYGTIEGDLGISSQSHRIMNRNELRQSYYELVNFVVGHEFGHAYHGHDGMFSMLPALQTVEPTRASSQNGVRNKCHTQEQQADEFFASRLSSKEDRDRAYMNFVSYINSAKLAANCPAVTVGYTCQLQLSFYGTGLVLGPGLIDSHVTSSHPSFMLRILNMLNRTYTDPLNEGFHLQFDNFDATVNLVEKYNPNDPCFGGK